VVDYVDEASGQEATLSSLELDVGEWLTGQSLPVHTRFLTHTQFLRRMACGFSWMRLNWQSGPTHSTFAAPKVSVQIANARLEAMSP